MVQGMIIPADNKAPLTAATFGTPADYNRAVDGWAEAVQIPHVGVTMHLNLEGSNRQLPYDRRATFLWWFHIPAVRGEARILGDVALVGPPMTPVRPQTYPLTFAACCVSPAPTASAYVNEARTDGARSRSSGMTWTQSSGRCSYSN